MDQSMLLACLWHLYKSLCSLRITSRFDRFERRISHHGETSISNMIVPHWFAGRDGAKQSLLAQRWLYQLDAFSTVPSAMLRMDGVAEAFTLE